MCAVSAGVEKSEYVCRNEGEMLSGKRPNEFWHRVQLGFNDDKRMAQRAQSTLKQQHDQYIIQQKIGALLPCERFTLYAYDLDACVRVDVSHSKCVNVCTA